MARFSLNGSKDVYKIDLGRLFALQEAQRYSVDEDRIRVSLWVSVNVNMRAIDYALETPATR